MSFGLTNKRPEEANKPANIDAEQLGTNEEGIIVSYFAGRARLKSLYITPAYNWKATEVRVQVAKGNTSQVGWKYFADVAAVFGMGPATKLYMVIVDSTVAWKSDAGMTLSGDSYTQITIPNYGDMRLFRGTAAQEKDTWVLAPRGPRPDGSLYPDFDPRAPQTYPDSDSSAANTPQLAGHYDVHPAYRQQVLATFKQLAFGQDRTSAPNIELVLERAPAWFSGQDPLDVEGGGVTPAGVLFEWLTNPIYGGTRSEADLDLTSWLTTESELAAAGVRLGVQVPDTKAIRARIAELLEYFDGFLYMKEGKLALGWYPQDDIDPSSLVQIGNEDLLEEPRPDPESWGAAITTVRVKHRERDQYFKENVQTANDNAARAIAGRPNAVLLSRPWILTGSQALAYAHAYQRRFALPNATAELRIRRSKGKLIRPGQRVTLNSATVGLSTVCRVLAKVSPEDAGAAVVLQVEKERGTWPALFVPEEQPRDPDFEVEAVLIQRARVLELPAALKTSASLQVSILAQRPDSLITGFRIHQSLDGGVHYDLQAFESPFAVYGRIVDENYSGGTADADTSVGIKVELLGIDIPLVLSQSDTDRDDGRWLIVVDAEIMGLGQVTALGGGKYRLFTRRAMYSTAKAAHAIAANVWIVERSQMVRLENLAWDVGETVKWKLQPHTISQDLDLADCEPPLTYTFAGGALPAPVSLALSSYARLASAQVIEVHLQALWAHPYAAAVASYEVAMKRTGDPDSKLVYRTVREASADFVVAPGVQYAVKVRAITEHGEVSAWSSVSTITAATDEAFGVSGLQLKGSGSTFTTEDAEFVWALNPTGIGSANQHPLLRDYRVRIYRLGPSFPPPMVREEFVSDPRYNYSRARNQEDACGRAIRIGVAARSTSGALSSEVQLDVSNPTPAAPALVDIGVSIGSDGIVTITPPAAPSDPDFVGYVLRFLGEFSVGPILPGGTPLSGGTILGVGLGPFLARQAPGSLCWYGLSALDTFDGNSTETTAYQIFSVTNGSVEVPAPSIDPPSSTATSGGTVTISVSVPAGYVLRFTVDGTTVRSSSAEWPKSGGSYTTLAVTETTHLRARLFAAADGRPGEEVQRIYAFTAPPAAAQVATPALSKPTRPGLAGNITATCATGGASIEYRKNSPGGSWTAYSSPVALVAGDLFEARATKSGYTPSEVAPYDNTNTYTGGGGGLEP